jgi:hypothetical protein
MLWEDVYDAGDCSPSLSFYMDTEEDWKQECLASEERKERHERWSRRSIKDAPWWASRYGVEKDPDTLRLHYLRKLNIWRLRFVPEIAQLYPKEYEKFTKDTLTGDARGAFLLRRREK